MMGMAGPLVRWQRAWRRTYGVGRYIGTTRRISRSTLLAAVIAVSLAFGVLLGGLHKLPEMRSLGAFAVSGSNEAGDQLQGLYVVRHGLRSPESIDEIVRHAKAVGVDALFVQVNGRSEAYYSSRFLVPAPGIEPGFDPLAYTLQRAREAGLAVHAWVNAYTAGMLLETPSDPNHILNKQPDWVTVDNTGRSLWDYDWREAQLHVPARMLDPGVPEVARFVFDSVMEVVRKYDVDGVHIDYVRYPSRRFGYHAESVRRFEVEHGFNPLRLEQGAREFVQANGRPEFERLTGLWDEWRREQVTSLVRRLKLGIRDVRPDAVFSVAVISDARVAVTERLQNWPGWLAEGLVDAIIVMSYNPDGRVVEEQVRLARDYGRMFNVPVYAGIGAYMLTENPANLGHQVEATLAAGAAGTVIFSHDTILEEPGIVGALTDVWSR